MKSIEYLLRRRVHVAALAVLATAAPVWAAGAASSSATLPDAMRPAFYAALADDAGGAYRVDADGCATLASQRLTACFERGGVRFADASPVTLRLTAWGRGAGLRPVAAVPPRIEGGQVNYRHGAVTEWWRVLPMGFEEGFTVARRPAGTGKLEFRLAVNRSVRRSGDNLAFGQLRYGVLVVTDATGKLVPATLDTHDGHVVIAVDDAGARYPLTVDPLVWIEQEVTAGDAGQANDLFGFRVLVSGDIAFVSAPAPLARGGVVYAFARSNGVWSETQTITPTPINTPPPGWSDFFGWSLALDGDTLLVGAPDTFDPMYGPILGAAYVFTNAGGTWTQQQELLMSNPDPSHCSSLCSFGQSVGVKGDTAVVGAYGYDGTEGSVFVFTDSGGTWSQTQQLFASDGTTGDSREFGLALDFDGTNLLVGAPGPDYSSNGTYPQGTVYAFTETGGSWAQAQEFHAGDGVDGDQFGFSLALDGSTLLVGAPAADIGGNTHQGAVYVFGGSTGTWTQSQKLTAADGAAYDQLGQAVALDGGTALAGEWSHDDNPNDPPPPPKKGFAYLFTASGGAWTQTQEFSASNGTDGDSFGWHVALDGSSLLIGADAASVNGNTYQGAAYFYGSSDLGLAVSAPGSVGQGSDYVSQAIATNSSSAASPAVALAMPVPPAASFVSASASQGSCSESGGVVDCAFGPLAGNGGSATANVTLKATGSSGSTIENTASVTKAVPPLTASAATTISACGAGYTEYDGTLAAGAHARSPIYRAPAGEENAILTGPQGFQLYAVTKLQGQGRKIYRIPGNEVHRQAPAGYYSWAVKAGVTGGAYTLCVMHP